MFRRGKTKTRKLKKLTGGWSLLKASLSDYRGNFRQLGRIGLVAVAINLFIRLSSSVETATIYQGLWFVFISCVFIWAIRHGSARKTFKLSESFWIGSAPALKFLLVLSLVALVTIPFALGAFIFSAINWLNVEGAPAALLIATAVWLVLGWLSLILLVRLLPGLIIVTLPEVGPGQAVGLSWRTSRGYTWRLSGRLLWILIFGLLLVLLIGLGSSLIPTFSQFILEAVVFGVLLPIFYLFLFKLYKDLT